jgi:hypothetical protein
MRDAFVAVDAGFLTTCERGRVHFHRAFALTGEVHGRQVVTVAALQRIVGFEPRPFVLRKLEPLVEKFFACVDGAEDRAPDFFRGLHLPGDLARPVMGNVTIRAGRAHARAVGVMDRWLQFHKNVVAHFVAAGTEFLGVGCLERGVEAAPKHDASDKTTDGEKAQAEVSAGCGERLPKPPDALRSASDAAHLVFPAGGFFAMPRAFSASTKVFSTGVLTSSCVTWHCVQK